MGKLSDLGKVIKTDILVVGGGPAGLWAANRAKECVENVLVVDKGPRDWGGLASIAGGDYDAVLPWEDVDDFVKDFVYYQDGLCDQDQVEEVFKHSFDRLKDYQRLGCEFLTGPDGKLRGIPQRSLDHVKLYPAKLKGTGGADMVRGLLKESNRLGVKRLGRIMITDLLKRDGRIAGAVGFNTYNGEFFIFKASAVVIATGISAIKSSYGKNTATGEGIYMAFRAGVELKNFEFVQVWNVPKLFAWEGQSALMPLGAKFVNARGEPFMDKYSPILGANTDPHFTVLGMAFEVREGRGPFYIDISSVKLEDRKLAQSNTGWQMLNYKKLTELDIDVFQENIEWMPQLIGLYGGLIADIEGRTAVPGLFTAGAMRGADPGCATGGFNLCRAAVTGHIVGKSVAEYVKSCAAPQIDEDEVKSFNSRLYVHLGKVGIPPKEVLREIQEAISPYDVSILKNETSLKRALSKIEGIKDDLLPQMGAVDAHYLMKLIEVQAIAFTTELYMRTSLMRTESRSGHYREDYPDRDDQNWLKWIVISQKNDKLSLRAEPVPFDKYKFKSTRYYMDNFQFPK